LTIKCPSGPTWLPPRPVWVEVDLDAIRHNVAEVKRLVGENVSIMAIVKADAYGHGAYQVARAALAAGADWLGVALLQEGVALRQQGIQAPILVLGWTPPAAAMTAIEYDLVQMVTDIATARAWNDAAALISRPARVHLKIDTGMGRLGIPAEQMDEFGSALRQMPHLAIEGVMTHFAASEEADKTYTLWQLERFQRALATLAQAGIEPRLRHAANSAAAMEIPPSHANLVRVGIAMYGLYPAQERSARVADLRPALAWKARVAFVKDVAAGEKLSYGCTYTVPATTRIATLPVGYADGYMRSLSNKGEVLLKGQRAPVVGRVCMDQMLVDVGHIPDVQPEDVAVLLGRQGDAEIPAEELAAKIGTINYEVVCMIGPRVPRLYRGQRGDGGDE
jgi:alanine racemase